MLLYIVQYSVHTLPYTHRRTIILLTTAELLQQHITVWHDDSGLGIRAIALHSSAQNRSPERATVSDSLLSKFKKEQPRANRSRHSLKKSSESDSLMEKSESLFRSYTHKNELFAQNTKERIPNPMMWQMRFNTEG